MKSRLFKTFFGNVRRSFLTILVLSLAGAVYGPLQVQPVCHQLVVLLVILFGLWVMLTPIRELINPPRKRRR